MVFSSHSAIKWLQKIINRFFKEITNYVIVLISFYLHFYVSNKELF